jgi:Ca2+/Na+ antiporter
MMVSGNSRLAIRWGVSPLIVGLTLVAFGTSAPELAVSIESTTSNLSALALGNVIGSNIANIGLVLGIMALIKPIRIERQLVRKQIPLVIISSMLMGVLLLDGQLDQSDGLFLTMACWAISSLATDKPALNSTPGNCNCIQPKTSGNPGRLYFTCCSSSQGCHC